MAFLDETFDATQIEPSTPFEVIPAGKYHVQIINSEMRDNSQKAGRHLWLEVAIMDGPYANRRVFDRLHTVNPNQDVETRAKRTLSAICHAIGQLSISNTEQLHNRSLIATIKVNPEVKDEFGNVQWKISNGISGYAEMNGQTSAAVSAPQTHAPVSYAAPASAGQKTATPPWRRAGSA